jgi:hypothetical protein
MTTQSFGTKTYSFTKNKTREIPIEFYEELTNALPGNFKIEANVTEMKISDKPIENKPDVSHETLQIKKVPEKFAIKFGKKEVKPNESSTVL